MIFPNIFSAHRRTISHKEGQSGKRTPNVCRRFGAGEVWSRKS